MRPATVLYALAGVVALAVGARMFGEAHWGTETRLLRERLRAAAVPSSPATYDAGELATLPSPVRRYIQTVLKDGQPIVATARMRHSGMFDMGQDRPQWKPFTSDQLVVTRRPGFDWDARVQMIPGIPVHVHDAYVAGEGILTAAVLGLVTVADLRGGGDVARGELMRFLAEAAWYPTALLPSQGVTWEPIDDRSARATLRDGRHALTLTFRFDDEGLIETVYANARGRTVSGKVEQTPWQGRFWNYGERDGVRIPLQGEVAWLLPDGPRPYWRGQIDAIDFTFTR